MAKPAATGIHKRRAASAQGQKDWRQTVFRAGLHAAEGNHCDLAEHVNYILHCAMMMGVVCNYMYGYSACS